MQASRHEAEKQGDELFCSDRKLEVEERRGDEITGLQDVEMEKNGTYFLEG